MKMFKKYIFILLMLLISPLYVDAEECTLEYDTAQQMIQESMRSYYIRGPYFQYNTAKYGGIINGYILPEEGTSQENQYLVCSGFVHAAMKTAFGMNDRTSSSNDNKIFNSTNALLNYAKTTNGDSNIVIFYGETGTTFNDTYQNFIKKIQPGDIFVYTGHTMMVYDKVDTDGNGTIDDVLLLHSWQAPYIVSRLSATARLSYNNFSGPYNYLEGLSANHKEGTVKQQLLSDTEEFVKNNQIECSKNQCAVIRPFYNNDGNAEFIITTNNSNCQKTRLRTDYPNLIIEKTVDKGDGNVVNVNDQLTYTIKITNYNNTDSGISFKNFTITENIGHYVEYLSSNNSGTYKTTTNNDTVSGKVKWNIEELNANESIELTYTVKVKNDLLLIDEPKIVKATGAFYNSDNSSIYIATGNVQNKIVPQVTKYNKTYTECYNELKENNKGLDLINKIYKCATNTDFKFTDFDFNKLIYKTLGGTDPENDSVIHLLEDYIQDEEAYASLDQTIKDKVDAYKNDETHQLFTKMILNNYFNGLTNYSDDSNKDYYFPKWTSKSNQNRAKNINPIDFKDGDILIYNIEENEKNYEKGTYAYIYIGSKFVGINGSGITERNEFYQTYYAADYWSGNTEVTPLNVKTNLYEGDWKNTTSFEKKFIHYQTLYDKNNYVILRPELVIKEVAAIKVDVENTKKTYIRNLEAFAYSHSYLTIIYNDNTTETVSMFADNIEVSGFDNTVKCEGVEKCMIDVIVHYNDLETTYSVEIVDPSPTEIQVISIDSEEPPQTVYIQNYETLTLNNRYIKVIYENGETDTISMTADGVEVSGFDNTKIGINTIIVKYLGLETTFDVQIEGPQVKEIRIIQAPTKTHYVQDSDEDLIVTGGIIEVLYVKGNPTTIGMDNEKIKFVGYDNTKEGINTIAVDYLGFTDTFDITIISYGIDHISVKQLPTKTNYYQNSSETLDLSGGVIEISYKSGDIGYVSMEDLTVENDGYDNSKVGTNTIVVEYEGYTTTFEITILSKQITSILLSMLPTKLQYIQNVETLDLTGGKIRVEYNDGTTSYVSLGNENIEIIGFDNSKLGTNNITVKYQEHIIMFEVEIIPKQVTNIEVSIAPIKSKYIQSYENLDLTGGFIKVIYTDNTTDTISMTNDNIKVTGFDNSKLGKNTITVEYEGHTTTFEVEIILKEIIDVAISLKPTKLNYIQNYEELDLEGGFIKVTYTDNTTDTISMTNAHVEITGFDNSKLGKNIITVTYKEHAITFDITIISKQINKIELLSEPTKTSYIQNYEDLDLTGGKILITYNDTTTDTLNLTNESITISGFDNSKIGLNTITVVYQGHVIAFDVEITSKQTIKAELSSIPLKSQYIQNYEDLDLTGGAIKLTYTDNTTNYISMTNGNVQVSGFDNSKLGKNTITVKYNGHTITFDVEIISKQITKIEIASKPLKHKYIQNYEKLNLSGGTIKVTYDDKTTDTISMTNENVKTSGFDNSKLGKNKITVKYNEYQATFDIEIISKQLVKIEIETLPSKTTYDQNAKSLDLTGGSIKTVYTDESTDIVSMENDQVKVSGFDNQKEGAQQITVTYMSRQTTFNIEITSNLGNVVENPKTGPSKIIITILIAICSIVGGSIFYKRYKLQSNN